MLYDYQVFYQGSDGDLRAIKVAAGSENEAVQIVQQSGIKVASIGPGFPIVDWSKPVLTREEAKVYLDISETKLWELQGKGLLPKPKKNGQSLFSRQSLEKFRREQMREEAA